MLTIFGDPLNFTPSKILCLTVPYFTVCYPSISVVWVSPYYLISSICAINCLAFHYKLYIFIGYCGYAKKSAALDIPYSTKLWRRKLWRSWNCKKIGGENFGGWQRQSPFNIGAQEFLADRTLADWQ